MTIIKYRQPRICGDRFVRIEKDGILIRSFTENDLPLMFKWLTNNMRRQASRLSNHYLSMSCLKASGKIAG